MSDVSNFIHEHFRQFQFQYTILVNKFTECQHLCDYSKQKQCHRSFPTRLIGLVIPLDFPTEEYNSSDHFVYFARVFISPVWGEES